MLLDRRTIGLIEDDPIMGESLWQALRLEGADVTWWRTGRQARTGLLSALPDIVICDIRLPDCQGGELYEDMSSRQAMPPFLFMTAFGQIDEAVRLLRAGAGDYVTKPFQIDSLVERINSLLPSLTEEQFGSSLGISPAIRRVETMLRKVADQPSTILLTGPTGSGKEVAAAFLHSHSTRCNRPFVAVNCAALPSELMESELFGHERGAFTGAHAQHRGFAERASNGVLFLDEICELPLPLQAKLLRLLEQRILTRLGGETEIPFEARIICASNRDPEAAAAQGRFRTDLLHRVNTIEIRIPPLRERQEDIEWLMYHFFGAFTEQQADALRGFAPITIEFALGHHWPGNVRELRNRVERAVALTAGQWIMPADMFPDLTSGESDHSTATFMKLADARADAERRQIERALQVTSGTHTEAAKLLGISRTTLWEKMKRLGLED